MKMIYRMWKFLPLIAFLSASLLPAQTQPAPLSDNPDGPDNAMMAPVAALANYMAHVEGAAAPSVFVDDGPVIIENFAPYIFRGKHAALDWNAAYRKQALPIKDLKCEFGVAHDFGRAGNRAYFVLPTTWWGIYPAGVLEGKPYPEGRYEEHGGWAFVLEEKSPGQWRIASYAWGKTDGTVWPTAPAGDAANATPPPQEGDVDYQSPDKAIMAPVVALASYMAHVKGAVLPSVFADDALVVENFAPYIFVDKHAVADWDSGYRGHAEERLKDLTFVFGVAHDFERAGKRAYFVLPTTWRGIDQTGHFEEHGAWSFVLDEKSPGQWRIAAYGWGATIETDWPLRHGQNGNHTDQKTGSRKQRYRAHT
jgi:hypothetical protein